MNALVVYYSRTGSTRKVAQAISDQLDGSMEEITEPKSRKGIIGFMRSGFEAMRQKPSKINPITANPADFDFIIIGSPVWGGSLSSPVRAFLVEYGKVLGNVAFFSTKGGSATPKLFAQMESLVGKAPVATLELRQSEVEKQAFAERLDSFLEKVKNT